ncbi:hypothetical protein Goshw_025684 [Gossypium schwendimanii]|uniref:Uncharacterized protein n=1 Tax=Gossypium schwendimanii TaxID=34291 RepID=A0A7J9NEU3_GOSSC|nr:hypothetical protein [Gossypium schwendimanii]
MRLSLIYLIDLVRGLRPFWQYWLKLLDL